jgi:hypothetical protein
VRKNPRTVDVFRPLSARSVLVWRTIDFKTTVGVYSLRAKSHKPLVSMPVSWKALECVLSANNPESLYFNPSQAMARVGEVDDLLKPVLSQKQFLANELISALPSSAKRTSGSRQRKSSVRAALRREAGATSVSCDAGVPLEIHLEGKVLRT